MSAALDKAFTLFIESGVHAGTVQRLAPGIYTLGSELEADVVLSDPGISAVHLILELDQQQLRLEPIQGSIAIEGEGAPLDPGGERYLSSPASFSIGDVRIRVTAPQDAVRAKKRVRMAAMAAGVALIGVVGIQVTGILSSPDPLMDQQTADVDRPSEPDAGLDRTDGQAADAAMAMAKAETIDVDPEPFTTIHQAADELRARLRNETLSAIEVTATEDRILVKGAAEPERMAAWQGVRMWFDSAFGQRFMMVADVKPQEKEEPPKLAIEAIWLGEEPYLMAGGRRFEEGSAIGDGWLVERIRADEVTFTRGDSSFSLTL